MSSAFKSHGLIGRLQRNPGRREAYSPSSSQSSRNTRERRANMMQSRSGIDDVRRMKQYLETRYARLNTSDAGGGSRQSRARVSRVGSSRSAGSAGTRMKVSPSSTTSSSAGGKGATSTADPVPTPHSSSSRRGAASSSNSSLRRSNSQHTSRRSPHTRRTDSLDDDESVDSQSGRRSVTKGSRSRDRIRSSTGHRGSGRLARQLSPDVHASDSDELRTFSGDDIDDNLSLDLNDAPGADSTGASAAPGGPATASTAALVAALNQLRREMNEIKGGRLDKRVRNTMETQSRSLQHLQERFAIAEERNTRQLHAMSAKIEKLEHRVGKIGDMVKRTVHDMRDEFANHAAPEAAGEGSLGGRLLTYFITGIATLLAVISWPFSYISAYISPLYHAASHDDEPEAFEDDHDVMLVPSGAVPRSSRSTPRNGGPLHRNGRRSH